MRKGEPLLSPSLHLLSAIQYLLISLHCHKPFAIIRIIIKMSHLAFLVRSSERVMDVASINLVYNAIAGVRNDCC